MRSKTFGLIGAASLAVGIAMSPVYAQDSNVGPIINDYSDRGVSDYDGPQPVPTTKAYRVPDPKGGDVRSESWPKKKDSGSEKKASQPIVNDYSSMGADGHSDPATAAASANSNSDGASQPAVNDYSNMGAEYGDSSSGTDQETAKTQAGDSAAPDDLTMADLVVGYENFNGNCAQCHGQDGVGSTFAPSLVSRLKNLDYAQFVDVVTNGKTSFNSSTGGYSVMPAWGTNPAVMEHMNQLWGYLKGRATGDIGTGRPQ